MVYPDAVNGSVSDRELGESAVPDLRSGRLPMNKTQCEHRYVHFFVQVLLGWGFLLVANLCLHYFNPNGIVHNEHLSPLVIGSLQVFEGVLLLLFTLAVASVLLLIDKCFEAFFADEGIAPVVARSFQAITVFAATVVYLISWSVYSTLGHFLDPALIRFGKETIEEIVPYVRIMNPLLFVFLVLLGVLGILLFLHVVPGLTGYLTSEQKRSILLSTGGTLVLLFIMSLGIRSYSFLLFEPVVNKQLGKVHDQDDYYEMIFSEDNGPLSAFVAGSWMRLKPDHKFDPPLDVRPSLVFPTEKQITLSQYRNRVNRNTEPKTNVLFIIVESLRADQLIPYGSSRNVMPAVNRLARKGLVFGQHYSQSSYSSYAFPAIFSSHFPLRDRHYYSYSSSSPYPGVMLYDILDQFDYRTGLFSAGNEDSGDVSAYLQTKHLDTYLHAGTYDGPTYVPEGDVGFTKWMREHDQPGLIADRALVREAKEWLKDGADAPFFLSLKLQRSHVPYRLPEGFPHRFGPEEIDYNIKFGSFPRDRTKEVKNIYANSLFYVDRQIKKIIDFLKRRGQFENTLVVVAGDHGEAFYEHGFAAHAGPLFNEVVRVPLIITGPGISSRRFTRPSQHIDIPPTVLSLLDLPPHPSFQGSDLLADPPSSRPVFMVSQVLAKQYAMVRDRMKIIYDARKETYYLYDLEQDPGEHHDLSREKPERLKQLARTLHSWQLSQLRYYRKPALYRNYYPPRYRFHQDD